MLFAADDLSLFLRLACPASCVSSFASLARLLSAFVLRTCSGLAACPPPSVACVRFFDLIFRGPTRSVPPRNNKFVCNDIANKQIPRGGGYRSSIASRARDECTRYVVLPPLLLRHMAAALRLLVLRRPTGHPVLPRLQRTRCLRLRKATRVNIGVQRKTSFRGVP